jgi:membrane fusion protein (multidrug efflux system)
METITVAVARERERVRTTTAIGTVRALRSVTLQNELPGTVREAHLEPGQIVEPGTLLVALDVAVEEAEVAALKARAELAETLLGRMQRARDNRGASEADVDRARAERDIARAEVDRARALIERKTIHAPFRARIGLADVHPGQYLEAGTELTTLQGMDEDVHVDFAAPQEVAAGLRAGTPLEIALGDGSTLAATIVAVDARVELATRNSWVRALVADGAAGLAPGSAVRVLVPIGAARTVVAVPVSALRKGPEGDHVFVVRSDEQGRTRTHLVTVVSGAVLDDEVVLESGLAAGETIAASGSFKLREALLVALAPAPAEAAR